MPRMTVEGYTTHFSKTPRYGLLTAMAFHGKGKSGHILWEFSCDCGGNTIAIANEVINGHVKSCKCLRAPDYTGKVFGYLTVLSQVPSKYGQSRWRVRCRCEKEYDIASVHLLRSPKEAPRSCGCTTSGIESYRFTGHGEIDGQHWGRLKNQCVNRRSRTLEFTITIEEAWSLFLQQERRCALSGKGIGFLFSENNPKTASLDRIDSSLGYVSGNVQWVHKDINAMKGALPDSVFIEWCRKIRDYREHV